MKLKCKNRKRHIILQTHFSQNREKRNLIIIICNGNFEMKLKGRRKIERDNS